MLSLVFEPFNKHTTTPSNWSRFQPTLCFPWAFITALKIILLVLCMIIWFYLIGEQTQTKSSCRERISCKDLLSVTLYWPCYQISDGEDIAENTYSPETLDSRVDFIQTHFGITVNTIHMDNESALIAPLPSEARSRGLRLELTLPWRPSKTPSRKDIVLLSLRASHQFTLYNLG